jgi:hypothetical protein
MKLQLQRRFRGAGYTIGSLYVDGKYFSDTLEDVDRGLKQSMTETGISLLKIAGQTAIPTGTYKVVTNVVSPKYSTREAYKFCEGKVPRLLDVKGYEGVLIHIGNYPEDTDGCILVGENKVKGQVINSTETFKRLYAVLETADEIIIEIGLTERFPIEFTIKGSELVEIILAQKTRITN